MPVVEALKSAKSLDDMAGILGYSPSGLSFLLYKSNVTKKYTVFSIPKTKGGVRTIVAPEEKLKALQRRLASILYQYLDEIEDKKKPRKAISHGFAKGKSIITNASVHRRRRYVFNVDLQDFFPSINFGRIYGVFIKDRRFEFSPKAATIIAQIACHNNSLPQGSPCSPVISNIIARILDTRLVRLARDHKCTYSRYVDDITFSTNNSTFPTEIATQSQSVAAMYSAGPLLETEVISCGFALNHSKSRMQVRGSRQIVTGLLVNDKVNITPEYYRTARSMCSSLFTTGAYYQLVPPTLAGGNLGDPPVKVEHNSLATLEGILSYIYLVRNTTDRRQSVDKKKEETATATRKLYHRFLFFKNFISLTSPVIITEGKTDPIYLKSAIERLSKFHPKLGAVKNGKFKSSVRFLKFTSTVRDVLQLGGGSGDLVWFIEKYSKTLHKNFRYKPLNHPVIVLIDNDAGAKSVFGKISGITKSALITTETKDSFYYVGDNLYLVKTPETGPNKGMTCIEDFFEEHLLKTVLDDKMLDLNKKHLAPGKYGKAVFAEKVVKPNKATINFAGFEPILERIAAVMDDYAAKKGAPAAL